MKFQKGNIILYESESSFKPFVIVSGSIKCYKAANNGLELFLFSLASGDVIFDNSCNIEALTDCEIRYVSMSEITLDHVLERNKLLNKVLTRNFIYDSVGRVSEFIYNDVVFFNSLKRFEVASMLGMQPETLYRVLKKLVKSDAISLCDRLVSVVDSDILLGFYE